MDEVAQHQGESQPLRHGLATVALVATAEATRAGAGDGSPGTNELQSEVPRPMIVPVAVSLSGGAGQGRGGRGCGRGGERAVVEFGRAFYVPTALVQQFRRGEVLDTFAVKEEDHVEARTAKASAGEYSRACLPSVPPASRPTA